MEKKLESRHLAAYLPYDVQVNFNNQLMYLTPFNFGVIFKDMNYYGLKLYLRPWSYLTKEIEVNGETFMPLVKIFGKTIERDILFEKMQTEHFLKSGLYRFVEYQHIITLLSWHFDLFGLIDSGLAIDINTLEKQ